ncbi:MAG: hypothetical protein ACYDHH_13250 [Solirubrobacteraceae bacterium]
MRVVVDLTAGASVVSLLDAEDFADFRVEVHGSDVGSAGGPAVGSAAGSARLADALTSPAVGWTASDGEHAFILIEALRRLSPLGGIATWETDLERMIVYAERGGWLDSTGTAIRAHVVLV